MLHVLCRIGRDAYAISCETVERVLPFASLKSLPGASHGLAGLLNYQGSSVPVVDICLVLRGAPAAEMFQTRIILCRFPGSPSGRLGLLAEGVTETRQLAENDFQPAGAAGEACVSDVSPSGGGLIQRIELPSLLPAGLLASLGLPSPASP